MVNSNVIFHATANIVIEHGVKIIFVGDSLITVLGGLDCGCSTTTSASSSDYDRTAGLSNPEHYIHLIGNESDPTSIGVLINQQYSNRTKPPSISFCNTLFENTKSGITTPNNTQYSRYTVDHCEFKSLSNAIDHGSNVVNVVTHSHFHDVNHVKWDFGGIIFDHCLFNSFRRFSSGIISGNTVEGIQSATAQHIAVRNSEIYGDGDQICLDVGSVTGNPLYAIYNNHIHDCLDGVRVNSGSVSGRVPIYNNTITDCSRHGVWALDTTTNVEILGNSFGRNAEYDIKLESVQYIEISDNRFFGGSGFGASGFAGSGSGSSSTDDDGESVSSKSQSAAASDDSDSVAIWIVNGQRVDVRFNSFVSMKRQHMMQFVGCTDIDIVENEMVDVVAEYGLIEIDSFSTVNISRNKFDANLVEYLVHIDDHFGDDSNGNGEAPERGEEPTRVSISFNTVTSNMVYSMSSDDTNNDNNDQSYDYNDEPNHNTTDYQLFGAIHVLNTDQLEFKENHLQRNSVSGPLLWIEGVYDGQVTVKSNTFQENVANINTNNANTNNANTNTNTNSNSNTAKEEAAPTKETFTNSQQTETSGTTATSRDTLPSVLEVEGYLDLLYLPSPYTTIVQNNIFVDNDQFDTLLHLNYLDQAHVTSIEYNSFIQRQSSPTTYIHIAGDGRHDDDIPSIHINNFYNSSNVDNFISTELMDIDANNNYFDGLVQFTQISDKIGDFCSDKQTGEDSNDIAVNTVITGMADFERVNMAPVYMSSVNMAPVFQCSWDFLNCSSVTNYRCEEAVAPTTSSSSSTTTSSAGDGGDSSDEEVESHLDDLNGPSDQTVVVPLAPTRSPGGGGLGENGDNPITHEQMDEGDGFSENAVNSTLLIVAAIVGMLLLIVCLEKMYSCWRHNHSPKLKHHDKCASRHHLSFSDGQLSIHKKTTSSMSTPSDDYRPRQPISPIDPVDIDYDARLGTLQRLSRNYPHDYHPRNHINHIAHISSGLGIANYPFGRVQHRHDVLDGDDDGDSSATEVYVDDHDDYRPDEDAPILSMGLHVEGGSQRIDPQIAMPQTVSPVGDHSGDSNNSTSVPPLHTLVHYAFGEMMNDDDFVVGSRTSEHSEYRMRTSSTLFAAQHHHHHHHHHHQAQYHPQASHHQSYFQGPGHKQTSYHSHHSVHSRNEGVLGHDEFIIRGSLEDAATTGM